VEADCRLRLVQATSRAREPSLINHYKECTNEIEVEVSVHPIIHRKCRWVTMRITRFSNLLGENMLKSLCGQGN
jgi:hypothetical protein